MSFPNVWHHRKVADTSSKACDVCFKPTTSVLITPEKQDFFYVCDVHLKDTRFCSPIVDHEAVAARKKKEMDDELDRVKKEYEEKQRQKKEKEDEKARKKDKDEEKDKEKGKTSKEAAEAKEQGKDAGAKKSEAEPAKEEEQPRVFALQRNFYQQRVDKKRQSEMAKRNRDRLADPTYFPSVPKGTP